MEFGSKKAAVAFALTLALLCRQAAGAIVLDYCSSQNLGTTSKAYWRWQSNGWCGTHCAGYAMAITQGQYCWCSDDVPADTVDISECDDTCPGFPDEFCGSKDGTLYGYQQLLEPSATVGGGGGSKPTPSPKSTTSSSSTSSTSSSSSSSTTTSSSSSIPTPTPTPAPTPTSSSPSPSTKSTHSSSHPIKETEPLSQSKPMSSHTTRIVTTSMETVSGTVVTHTVVQTTVVGPAPAESTETPVQSSGPSGGTIAGAVIGGLAGFAAIIGLAIFALLRFRRRQNSQYAASDAERTSASGMTRNTSVLSKTGLLGRPEKAFLPPINTGGRRSNNALDMESSSPGSDRRNSRPIFYDQRLNPSALMDNDSSSRASIGTMQDNRDYTRTLNVRNPDPDDDAESIAEPDHEHHVQTR